MTQFVNFREPMNKKEYSRAMTEENWRNRATDNDRTATDAKEDTSTKESGESETRQMNKNENNSQSFASNDKTKSIYRFDTNCFPNYLSSFENTFDVLS